MHAERIVSEVFTTYFEVLTKHSEKEHAPFTSNSDEFNLELAHRGAVRTIGAGHDGSCVVPEGTVKTLACSDNKAEPEILLSSGG